MPSTAANLQTVRRPVRQWWTLLRQPAFAKRLRLEAAFYRKLVPPGALVFDVGANVGFKTLVFRRLGCRVVALEPNLACQDALHWWFVGDAKVKVEPVAAGESAGTAQLHLGNATALSSLSPNWQITGQVDAHRTVPVRVLPLDKIIARHGRPAFAKLDTEGFEPQVLAGLSLPLDALSFEFTARFPELARQCIARLAQLGHYEFNWARLEHDQFRMRLPKWINADQADALLDYLAQTEPCGGDLYARRINAV